MDEYTIPASQMANEAFESNPADQPLGPTSFDGAFAEPPANGTAPFPPAATPIVATYDSLASAHGKLINDPIHGAYRLDPACTLLFDTPEFQRLRRLKQLGTAYYVFPGACHNRFEHSLGVAHLAFRFSNQLWMAQRSELDITRADIRVVGLAGLCHDLGHGPFSHVFDREFLRAQGVTNWEHEDMSALMLDHIIDSNHIDAISADDVKRIKGLITAGHGDSAGGTASHNRWLGEIVANGRNAIDVDKFDYLARDSQYCGVKVACDFSRIMQFSRVIGDEICMKYTEYMNLYELFHARATMHRSVYTHKKSKAIEYMVVDALLAAEPALKITEKIWAPAAFAKLDDGLLDIIENWDVVAGACGGVDEGAQAAIADAQKIISRIRRRRLYKYVTDALVPPEVLERGQWAPPTAQDVIAHYRGSDVDLCADDVIIQENKIDYSMANKNPLDSVHFYDYLGDTNKRKLRPDQISSMVVAAFQEKRLRLYSRNDDPRVVVALHQAFENWLKHRFGGQVETSTPAKPLRVAAAAAATAAAAAGVKRRCLFSAGEGPPLPPGEKRGRQG